MFYWRCDELKIDKVNHAKSCELFIYSGYLGNYFNIYFKVKNLVSNNIRSVCLTWFGAIDFLWKKL